MAMRSRQLKQKTPELLLSFQSEAPSYKDIDIDESKEEKDSQCYMSLSSYQIPQTSESFERIIIDTLKKEDSLDLQSKILFTYYIIQHSNLLVNLSDFYEEECHLSLLNWIWRERAIIKNPYSSFSMYHYITLNCIIELLNNILIIFETLPIKANDILDLNLYEKLNKIKGFISKWNLCPPLLASISFVLGKWKNIVDIDTEEKMKQKRNKNNDDDTEADSEDNNIINSITINNIQNKPLIKDKKVSFDFSKNNTVYYDKAQSPSAVGDSKSKYDPIKL